MSLPIASLGTSDAMWYIYAGGNWELLVLGWWLLSLFTIISEETTFCNGEPLTIVGQLCTGEDCQLMRLREVSGEKCHCICQSNPKLALSLGCNFPMRDFLRPRNKNVDLIGISSRAERIPDGFPAARSPETDLGDPKHLRHMATICSSSALVPVCHLVRHVV